MELLLEHGANVNTLESEGGSALSDACFFGYSGIVELLLAYNADVNAVSGQRGSPLFIAAAAGNEDIVRLLFEKGARLRKEDWADCEGWKPGIGPSIVLIHKLDSIYDLVKDEDPEEYIRILIEEFWWRRY